MYLYLMIFLFVFYVLGILIVNKVNIRSEKIANFIFGSVIFVSYIYCVYKIYLSVGVNDWNFFNALPVANVSPFMYVFSFFCLFFPKKIQKYVLLLISLLSFAMFCAGILSCVSYIMRHYAFHFTIALDAFVHVLLSLYGVYLVKSGQVKLSKTKDVVVSGGIIVGVAIIMMVFNLIFDTSFFGLSLYGKHNIYNMVLVGNSIVSAFIYFGGLCLLLVGGYYFQKIINAKKD